VGADVVGARVGVTLGDQVLPRSLGVRVCGEEVGRGVVGTRVG